MKKLFVAMLVMLFSTATFAQGISVNVHVYAGNQWLYFSNNHAWMQRNGYRYNDHGYYIRKNKRIYPTHREYYHSENKRWSKYKKYNNNNNLYKQGRGNNKKSSHEKRGR